PPAGHPPASVPDAGEERLRGTARYPPQPSPSALPAPYDAGGYAAAPYPSVPSPAAPSPGSTWAPRSGLPARARALPYPGLALGAVATFLLAALALTLRAIGGVGTFNNSVGMVALVLAALGLLSTWIGGIARAARLRRRGWLVSMLLLNVYAVFVFALRGPTTSARP
ncbi:MAG: hypothetical protein IVW57_19840, partial [Ktedonobacterales bacterium]|nr:hypothetical protein [Ktedonobacterales bacterium]